MRASTWRGGRGRPIALRIVYGAVVVMMVLGAAGCGDLSATAPSPTPQVVVVTQPPTVPPTSAPARAPEIETIIITAPPTEAPPTASPATPRPTPIPSHVSPAAAGTYRYRAETSDEDGSHAAEWEVEVAAPRSVEGETRQVIRHPQGDGPELEEHRAWRPTGVYMDRLHVSGDDFDCEPPVLLYPHPLEVGQRWEQDSSCTYERTEEHEYGEGTASFTFVQQASHTITGVDRLVVDGAEVGVYVVEATREERDGATRQVEQSTEWFAPGVGLRVRFEGHLRVFEDGELVHEARVRHDLVSLRPQ